MTYHQSFGLSLVASGTVGQQDAVDPATVLGVRPDWQDSVIVRYMNLTYPAAMKTGVKFYNALVGGLVGAGYAGAPLATVQAGIKEAVLSHADQYQDPSGTDGSAAMAVAIVAYATKVLATAFGQNPLDFCVVDVNHCDIATYIAALPKTTGAPPPPPPPPPPPAKKAPSPKLAVAKLNMVRSKSVPVAASSSNPPWALIGVGTVLVAGAIYFATKK